MINHEQLAAFLEGALDGGSRDAIENELEHDAEALQFVIEQRQINRALRSVLGIATHKQRLKESILAAVAGASLEQLRAQVLADTSGPENRPVMVAGRATAAMTPANTNGVSGSERTVLWRAFRTWTAVTLQRFNSSVLGRFAAAAAVLVVLGVGSYLFTVGRKPVPQAQVGELAVVIGTPNIRRAGGRVATEATRATPVRFGDRIETGDADKAEIQFRDGTTLRLRFNTIVEIPNPKSESSNQQLATGNRPSAASRSDARAHKSFNASTLQRPPEINLLRGQVWTKVQKTTNAPQYAVRTPMATAVARGTEFGVQLQKATASTNSTVQLSTSLVAVLTVKEGTVDFTNTFGTVQATAMTESTASVGAAPTEPRRLQTLQTVQLATGASWSLVTSPLALPDVAERLVGGGGWAGLVLHDFLANAPSGVNSRSTSEVRVARVLQNSPAGRARIVPGEAVLTLEGRVVTNAAQAERVLLANPEATVSLKLRGSEGGREVALTLTTRPSLVPGPALAPADRIRLAAFTREMIKESAVFRANAENSVGRETSGAGSSRATVLSGAKELQAAAQNNLGVILESEDALGPAIRAYGHAVYIDPKVSLYHFNLGLALRKIGSFERAEEELEAAAELTPGSTEPGKWLASTRSLLGRHTEALAQTEALLAVAPRDHSLWEVKSQLLTKQSRFAESLDAARKAVELDPDCPAAHGFLGDAWIQQGNQREAEASYQRALTLAPFEALHHMGLGLALRNRGQFASAEQRFRKAIELRPDLVVGYENLGLLYASTRRDAQAEEVFRKALAVDPDNVEVLRKLGYIAAENARLDEAEVLARKVLELAPHESGSHNDLGEVLRQKGKFDEAIQSYRKALELRPNSPGVLNNIAIIQAMRGQHAEAEKTFRTLIDLAAQDARINPLNFLINLAMVCDKQGKLEDAENFYRQALALNPNDPGTCNGLAWFLADHRLKLDEALTLGRRAVEKGPDDPNFLDTLGWVHFQRGELDDAEKSFKKSLQLAPQNPSAPEIREHLKKTQEKKEASPK